MRAKFRFLTLTLCLMLCFMLCFSSLTACSNVKTEGVGESESGSESELQSEYGEVNTSESTDEPTESPTEVTTDEPTESPTEVITDEPTESPTEDTTEGDTREIVELGSLNLIWTDEVAPIIYDGQNHTVEITNLPDYLEATYNGGCGIYPYGTMYPDTFITVNNYYEIASITVKEEYTDRYVISGVSGVASIYHVWRIEKADMSMPEYEIEQTEYYYNGSAQTPSLTDICKNNLEEQSISWSFSADAEQTDAGTYSFTVSFMYTGEDAQYFNLGDGGLIGAADESWTINKAQKSQIEGMLGWSESEFTYDGTEKSVTVTGLIDGLSISYQNNAYTNANTDGYTATATIDVTNSDNYDFEQIVLTRDWIINPKTLSGLELWIYAGDLAFTGDEYSTGTYNYTKALSAADGIIYGDTVNVNLIASDKPTNGVYSLGKRNFAALAISCSNDNYAIQYDDNMRCGKVYICDTFDVADQNTVDADGAIRYFIMQLEVEDEATYYFRPDNEHISFSLKDENLNEIAFTKADGFTLTNDSGNDKVTRTVYLSVKNKSGESKSISIYSHIVNLIVSLKDGDINYRNLYVLDNYDISTVKPTADDYSVTGNIIMQEKEHYTFGGWCTESGEEITNIKADCTLYATWYPTVYTITFTNTENVKNENVTSYTIESEAITLSNLNDRADYKFDGWYYNGEKITSIPNGFTGGNITLKAKWNIKEEYNYFQYTVDENNNVTITDWQWNDVDTLIIPRDVVAISDGAFENYKTLKTVIFEDSDKPLTIGNNAFKWCGVSSIDIPSRVTSIGDYAFSWSGLTEINFADDGNLTSIGNYAFDNCSGLSEVTIPDSVVSIGKGVFNSCIGMTKVVFGKGITVIGEDFYGSSAVLREMEFKGALTSCHKNAFSGLSVGNITLTLNWEQKNLELSVSVDVGGMSNLGGSLNIGSTTKFGDEYDFQSVYYRMMTDIDTGTFCGVTFANIYFVCDATNMTADEFGDILEKCSTDTFINMIYILPAIADDYFPKINTLLKSGYSDGTVNMTIKGVTSISENAFLNCTALGEVIIGEDVERLENSAFNGCKSLRKVIVGDNVQIIGNNAFNVCMSLVEVQFSKDSKLTEIGQHAFCACTSLPSIVIPSGVSKIHYGAFYVSGGDPSYVNVFKTAYYMGTAEQWNDIDIGDDNLYLTHEEGAVHYFYSESQPAEEGNYWHFVDGVPTEW